jgi:hypothetical protein
VAGRTADDILNEIRRTAPIPSTVGNPV